MKTSKVLLVTGASSDIGYEFICRVAEQYEKIIAHYRQSSDLIQKMKDEMGDKLILLQADFGDEESTDKFCDALKELELTVDHFVHLPAAKLSYQKFHKILWEQFEKEYMLSVRSFVKVAKFVLPKMVKQKYGKILVMLTSCTVGVPPKFLSSYVASKYALLGLTKSLANEYSDKGITVNGISPEMIETKFLADIPDLVMEKNATSSPLGRNLCINDVVPMMAFLLYDDADAITGQNFAITGGR